MTTSRLTAAIAAAKCYPPIEGVAGHDLADDGPIIDALHVEHFEGRITLAHDALALTLTPAQTLALESRLAQARADVDAAQDGPPTETFAAPEGPPVRCEVCGGPIAPGSAVASWTDGGRQVVAHAGRCPEPEIWVAEFQFATCLAHGCCWHSDGPTEKEDAYVRMMELKRWADARVRLVRVRKESTHA